MLLSNLYDIISYQQENIIFISYIHIGIVNNIYNRGSISVRLLLENVKVG